jgi:hypothetical protein
VHSFVVGFFEEGFDPGSWLDLRRSWSRVECWIKVG